MKKSLTIAALLASIACGPSSVVGYQDGSVPVEPPCTPSEQSETQCGDGIDSDCDRFADCLDPDCNGMSCGPGELICSAGGCPTPCTGADCPAELPPIVGVSSHVN